jgi:predicted NAD/FAD-binding protein
VDIRLATRIKQLETGGAARQQVYLDNECFDAVIVATAPYHANDLLKTIYAPETRQALQKLEYSAITTVYLQYQICPKLPKIIQGFADGVAQWVINRDALGLGKNEVAAVCSVTQSSRLTSKQDWVDAVHQDLLRIDGSLSEPIKAQVITEKRATIQAAHSRAPIPSLRLSHHGIYLAGDYMHPVYPATLEGAVQSGQQAAAMLLADWNSKCQ